ncbi:ethylene-responsive transcription factor-like protein At4g13040 isoform X2 [Impatiens glandulifera]|nr:ethylene-responsive transcription factor-like protein At4g13040 isoform X2 [Impatiens glandulifera]
MQSTSSISARPMPLADTEGIVSKASLQSSNASDSSSSKEQPSEEFPGKRKKRYRRKHLENQEPCLVRGVYFKNMKWQAAIKVDKKQIHLGTVGSQEEAAHLYDRAAFMCGREPNSELSEEEKQELGKFKWEEFLAMTRSMITSKKNKRQGGGGLGRKSSEPSLQNSDQESEHGGGNVDSPTVTSSIF